MAPPFIIEACNKNQTPLSLGAIFKLKNDPYKFHVELSFAYCMEKNPKILNEKPALNQ